MQSNYYSQQELNRLLSKYITCLDLYFHTLHEAVQQAKKSSTLQYSIDNPPVEILERFIIVGKKIQNVLKKIHEKNY